jgi:MFS family permease
VVVDRLRQVRTQKNIPQYFKSGFRHKETDVRKFVAPANNANVALYSTFSVVGFFAGTFTNKLGIKLTLSFGGLGYFIYASSLLSYNHTQNDGFLIFAGALLGVCAGLLWTAQGAIMMSYPPEGSKGRYISWFWMIFNLGAVIGSLVRFYLLNIEFHTSF